MIKAMDSQPPPQTASSHRTSAAGDLAQPRADFLKVSDFNFYYGKKQALYQINMDIPSATGDRLHRSVGLRQIHAPPQLQPDE